MIVSRHAPSDVLACLRIASPLMSLNDEAFAVGCNRTDSERSSPLIC